MSIFYYIKDTVLNLFNYFFKYKIKNNINNDINIQIEFFLKEIYENWKNKNINELLSDEHKNYCKTDSSQNSTASRVIK